MSKLRTLQFINLEDHPDDSEAITLLDATEDKVHIWFENDDGECTKTFNRNEFEAFVRTVNVFKGWDT